MIGSLSILWNYAQAKRSMRRWRSRSDLEAWQNRQVQYHLRRVLPRSAYYRELYDGLNIAEWKEFPVITKTEMMENFSELNTVGLQREKAFELALKSETSRDFRPMVGNVTVGLSSGTSGNRGIFLVCPTERYAWAGNLLAKILPTSILNEHRAALFLRANSNLYESVATRRFSYAFFDLLEPLPELIFRLQQFQPTLLIAPPSVLSRLAAAQRDGKMELRLIRIFSAAEVLEPQDARFIEEQFQTRVHQIYQATEGFLGATCSHGTLHLNEDLVVVQKDWLNQGERKFVPIITDFRRLTQPIIRYRLNDILTENSSPCPCGSPFIAIEKIEGRCDDIFVVAKSNDAGTVEIFPDFVRRAIMTTSEAVTEYRAIQQKDGTIEIQLETSACDRDLLERSIRRNFEELCQSCGGLNPTISFRPLTTSGFDTKRRRVIRVR